MDWEECKNKEFVKQTKIDEGLISSLMKSSENKLKSANLLRLDAITAPSKLSLVYDSLREILEALAIKKGLKIYNHECFCSFLKELCNEEVFSEEFNSFRKIRNQINYYAKDISIIDAEIIIKEMIKLRSQLFDKFFR